MNTKIMRFGVLLVTIILLAVAASVAIAEADQQSRHLPASALYGSTASASVGLGESCAKCKRASWNCMEGGDICIESGCCTPARLYLPFVVTAVERADGIDNGAIDCYDFDHASDPASGCCPVGDLAKMGCPEKFGCVVCGVLCYEAGHVCD